MVEVGSIDKVQTASLPHFRTMTEKGDDDSHSNLPLWYPPQWSSEIIAACYA